MKQAIRLSDDLVLPPDAVTQTFGILATRGAGKTNLARVMAGGMHAASIPFVVVDPVGAWWGLRSSRDGRGPGLPIPIFGGRHGDVPLEKTGGQVIADAVVDQRLTCVLDVSELSEGDKTRFLIDFAERLYRKNTQPLHLFLEEADDYVPQRPFREQARLLRAWENVVRRGRARGLGITMITQRSAALNKNVLTQIETLFVLRTTSPQDRKAIAAWVEYHAESEEVLESLSSLATGEAWVWSPSWLKVMKRVKTYRSKTFDSGATPKEVKATRKPATLADVDLDALKVRMSETIERARADDPKSLKLKVGQLEREIRDMKMNPPEAKERRVEIPVLKDAQIRRLEKVAARMTAEAERHGKAMALLWGNFDEVGKSLGDVLKMMAARLHAPMKIVGPTGPFRITNMPPNMKVVVREEGKNALSQEREGRRRASDGKSDAGARLPVGERSILTAIAQHDNHDGCTREQLTVLTGYKRSSRDTYLQRLREKELVSFNGTMFRFRATLAGLNALGPNFVPLPTGDQLRQYWLQTLPKGEREILSVVTGAYPKNVEREQLSEMTGYKRSSRDTYLQRLQARMLVLPSGHGAVRASEELFESP